MVWLTFSDSVRGCLHALDTSSDLRKLMNWDAGLPLGCSVSCTVAKVQQPLIIANGNVHADSLGCPTPGDTSSVAKALLSKLYSTACQRCHSFVGSAHKSGVGQALFCGEVLQLLPAHMACNTYLSASAEQA